MARGDRTKGFRAFFRDHFFPGAKRRTRNSGRRIARPLGVFVGMEPLEARLMLSATPTPVSGVLTCTGMEGESNTISVDVTDNGNVMVATVDGLGATFSSSQVQSLLINAGSRHDIIIVSPEIGIPETLTEDCGSCAPQNSDLTPVQPAAVSQPSPADSVATSLASNSVGTFTSNSTSAAPGASDNSSTSSSSSASDKESVTPTPPPVVSTPVVSTPAISTPAVSTPVVSPSNPSDPATPDAVITVTSPSTILPLESVNVQAVKSTFGSGTDITSTIAWDFGDPGSKYNDLEGFNAAHAYANPGTYTITLTITTPDGDVGVATQTVTIGQDNRNTIYVSPAGNDQNNGSSANSPIESIDRLNQLITSNTRVLFQDGGTYLMTDSGINVGGLQHVYIGSYGTGTQPILMYNGTTVGSMIGFSVNSQGIVVQGLVFDSIYNTPDIYSPTDAAPDVCDVVGNDITLIGNTFYRVSDDFNLNQNPTNVLIQGNSSPTTTDLYDYFVWVEGQEINILGNTVANSINQSVIRVDGPNTSDINISYNNLAKTTPSTDSYKSCLTLQWYDYLYAGNNTLTNGPLFTGPLTNVTGANATSAASSQNTVIDSNVLNNSKIGIDAESINTMIRNNVINPPDAYALFVNSTDTSFPGVTWQVQNLWIENNTVTSTDVDSGFLYLDDGESQNIHLDNNLFIDPDLVIGDAQSAYLWNGNNDMNSFTEIKDNVWGMPASEDLWENGGEFVLGDGQTDPNAWLTPAQWEAEPLSGGGNPSGDVYENVLLGATYSVNADGFTAGSSLPTP